jgi:hypothetical protein
MHALRPVLLLLALVAPLGQAQTPIHHCIGADGQPVFTDQPCASLHATPAPATAGTQAAPSLRPPAVTCAADLEQLRQASLDAFANADANRLAGLMLWSGYRERTAVADIEALAALMRRPLVAIDVPSAAASASPSERAGTPPELLVHTLGDDGSDAETRFAIERDAGCLWLRQE